MNFILGALALVVLLFPLEQVPPVRPMSPPWASMEPYLSRGAYADCATGTIRVNEALAKWPTVYAASVLRHEWQHLKENCQLKESGALTMQAIFLDMADGGELFRDYIWQLQREAVDVERRRQK